MTTKKVCEKSTCRKKKSANMPGETLWQDNEHAGGGAGEYVCKSHDLSHGEEAQLPTNDEAPEENPALRA